VIFAVGSPLVVDMEESLHRAGFTLAAGIHNIGGPHYLSDQAPLVHSAELTARLAALPWIVPLFTPAHRQAAVREARALGFGQALSLIDPSVAAPRALSMGEGCWVNAGCSLGGASLFEDFVLINRGASVGHHARFGPFVSIGPGATIAGQVEIGRGAVVGAGAVVLPKVRIGANAVVGAGAVVTRDVPDQVLVLGSPARIVERGIGGYGGRGVD
jgi:sugar O-acyltransferase (sialic acid O-acetyltransferase NeuD family)